MDGYSVIFPRAASNFENETAIKVLLIGIGYIRQLLDQWISCTSPLDKACVNRHQLAMGIVTSLNDFVHLHPITNSLTEYSTSVKRYFLRGLVLEDRYNPYMVHSLTTCTDSIRDSFNVSPHGMSCNACSRYFQ